MNTKKVLTAFLAILLFGSIFWALKMSYQNAGLKEEVLDLKKQIADLGDTVAVLKNKFDTANLQLSEMKGRLDVQVNRNKVLESENRILQQTISNYTAQLALTRQKMDVLENRKRELEWKLSNSQENEKITQQEKEDVEREKNAIDEELKLKKIENINLNNSLEEIGKKIVSIQLEYSKDGVKYFDAEYGSLINMVDAKKIRLTFNTVGNIEFKVQLKIFLNGSKNAELIVPRTFLNGQCVYEFTNEGKNSYSVEVWNQDFSKLLFEISRIIVTQ